MSGDNKMADLIGSLLDQTKSGRIEWSSGSREDTFLWSGRSASVQLSTQDNDGQAPWVVRLLDQFGRLVEQKTYDPFADVAPILGELYNRARSSALNIDATIDELLNELGHDDEIL